MVYYTSIVIRHSLLQCKSDDERNRINSSTIAITVPQIFATYPINVYGLCKHNFVKLKLNFSELI